MLICQFGEDDWSLTSNEVVTWLSQSVPLLPPLASFCCKACLEKTSELRGEALPFLPALGFQETKDGTEHKASLGTLRDSHADDK